MEVKYLKGSVFNRVITQSERQAYKNLQEYDGGRYKIRTYDKIKQILITKLLINTAMIPFNHGGKNIEGILTLQGNQGIGKTRLIKKLIPIYVKTGLELGPSDKDKVYQCIKYWVAEL